VTTGHSCQFHLPAEDDLVDISRAISLFEETVAEFGSDWDFQTAMISSRRERQHDSLEKLASFRGKADFVGFEGRDAGAEVGLGFSNKFVSLSVNGKSAERDEIYLTMLERLSARLAFRTVEQTLGVRAGAGTDAAGFLAGNGVAFEGHHPVMFFRGDAIARLDADLLREAESVREVESVDGAPLLRVQLCPLREYSVERRELGFKLIAPVRCHRVPVTPSSRESIVWERMAPVEAVLAIPYDDWRTLDQIKYPEWHPDRLHWKRQISLEEWESQFDDHLRLPPEVWERSESFVFPVSEWIDNLTL